ncbi:sugar kinase [Micromonospora sp. DR5-3]|uniref:sugar kinase n=1 Tax=unclassified Micromonospora TaxID=2617518 RepID=UPI0011DA93E7|nr:MULTISPECIES: sugar kinase [unclassified Micromonospora]MCW3816427.1 sugar kinase [Micromonospora sp. DR5-3]TYC21520.1 sugar kinase [Micromonospora sp. MP36]
MVSTTPDVLVLGEILVELTALEPLRDGAALRLGFSGDALNAAAAAAAAGAHTCLLARVPEDELGDELVARVAALGIDTSCLIRTPGQHGLYLQHADPAGQREFVYVRRGSAGSCLSPADVPQDLAAGAGVVLSSGVACAISTTTFEAVRVAAHAANRFVYDPNWRPRLVDADTAAGHLRALAPHARLVTPAWPREAAALLDAAVTDPAEACAAFRALGPAAVALTRGADGVLLDDGGQRTEVPAYPAERIVDQTGAGDVLAGTVAARLALGDDLPDAIRLGAAAAALSLGGHGGTGYLPALDESRRLVAQTEVEVPG